MFQGSSYQTIKFFPAILGSLIILLALFNKQLLRFIRLKPLSEVFTVPRFQHSAKITETLGRWVVAMIGIGFLIQGIGPTFLSSGATYTISWIVLGLAGLILLSMLGVVLANWKA